MDTLYYVFIYMLP